MQNTLFDHVTQHVGVLLPIPIPQSFSYSYDQEPEKLTIGMRVVVPFGEQNRLLTGIIISLHPPTHTEYKLKPIIEVLDEIPTILPIQLTFWDWLASYYLCYNGEIMQAAIPSGFKITSAATLSLHPSFKQLPLELSENETELIELLKRVDHIKLQEASKLLPFNITRTVHHLQRKKILLVEETYQKKYKPKWIKNVRLAPAYIEEKDQLETLFNKIQKKPKQEEVLLTYLQTIPVYQNISLNQQGIPISVLKNKIQSSSSLNTLIKNGIFEVFETEASRLQFAKKKDQNFKLSKEQNTAYEEITAYFESKSTVLLHGVTGSGKTEIYIKLIQEVLDSGHQVLMLLPEIAITTQMLMRLGKVFGDDMGVYHSKISNTERVEIWRAVQQERINFVLGARSSIFLPFTNIGLVIIDEEHEQSYKQHEPAPYYHGRDAALLLAHLHHAKTLLGSATPSINSMHLALQGVYGYVKLTKRYQNTPTPDIKLIDLRKAHQQKRVHGPFSQELIEAVRQCVADQKQVLLFQNRRGFAPYLVCQHCGVVPECINCAVSLTYHLANDELRCHYCGYKEKQTSTCQSCGSTEITQMGYGTERLEEELQLILPKLRIIRMDADSTKGKHSMKTIIELVNQQQVDVIIGTQMVAKGLDFEHLALVGILNIDHLIHFPDYRAHEKAFQMAIQVGGRSGRRDKQGQVLIQSFQPNHPIVRHIVKGSYTSYVQQELDERLQYQYPPYTRMIQIICAHKNSEKAWKTAFALKKNIDQLHLIAQEQILGPQACLITKVKNYYRVQLLIKLPKNRSANEVKQQLFTICKTVPQQQTYRGTKISINVDPI